MFFERAFWPSKDGMASVGDDFGEYPYFVNLERVVGQPILAAYIPGDAAKRAEVPSPLTPAGS